MNNLVALSIALVVGVIYPAQRASATPYCAQLLDEARLGSKYKRLAPIYSSVETGWIFTSDQLKPKFDMKPEAVEIMGKIISEFSKRGLPLAIVIAPPRPIVAGQKILDATMGAQTYDIAGAASSFDELINRLQNLGAIAPNLLSVARLGASPERPFYFRRDTHWTTQGAALSAAELAWAVRLRMPEVFTEASPYSLQNLSTTGEIEERGSLADIVRATCKENPDHEIAPSFDFGSSRSAGTMGLLGPSVRFGPRVALLGSSFSDRYGRDHYRFSDALAATLQAEIDNLSISGGGMIGAIESFVLRRSDSHYDLLLWEVPYTQSFNVMSNLRQLLGALQSHASARVDRAPVRLKPSGKIKIDYSSGFPHADLLIVDADGTDLQKLVVRMEFTSRKSERFRLSRKKHIPVARRSAIWALSLSGIEVAQISRITLEYDPRTIGADAAMYLMRAAE